MKPTPSLFQAIADGYIVAQRGHSPLAAAYRRHQVEAGAPFVKVTMRDSEPICIVEVDLVGQPYRLSSNGYFELRELFKRAHMGLEKPSNTTHSRTLMISKRVRVEDAPALVAAILKVMAQAGAREQLYLVQGELLATP